MKTIYIVNENNAKELKLRSLYPDFDNRIGHFIEQEIADSFPINLSSKLSLGVPFPLRTVEEDVNNPVLILPTDFAPNLAELFDQVYLVMTLLNFNANLGTWIMSSVQVDNIVNFTPISLLKVTGLDDVNMKPIIRELVGEEWYNELEQAMVTDIPAETITDVKIIYNLFQQFNRINTNKQIKKPILFKNISCLNNYKKSN